MSYLIFNAFGGIAPINDKHKLPAPHGQQSVSCKFEGGNVRPETAPTAVDISYPYQAENTVSLFHIEDRKWLRWEGDVAAVRGPVSQEVDYLSLGNAYRIYYCGDTGETPEWARFTTQFRAMGNADPETWFDGPSFKYPLGVPPPQSVPLAVIGGTPAGSFTGMSKTNPVVCSGIEPHNLTTGSRVRLVAGIPVSGDGSELAGIESAVTVTGGTSFKLDSVDGTAWATNLVGSFSWERVYQDQELEDRIYAVTFVNEFGEESKPSLPSAMLSVGTGQFVTVTSDTTSSVTVGSSPAFVIVSKRIYRSVTGTSQAEYLFVAERPIAEVSYDDTIGFEAVGEICPTETYDLPPYNLRGITVHPNGYGIGFVDNELFLSEPYLLYAWPSDYRKTLAVTRIVRVITFGATVVVLTDSEPFIGFATDPASLSLKGAELVYPCVHRQAAVSTGYSVVYVSPVGLIAYDQSGPRVITEPYYSVKQWQDLIGFTTDSRCALTWQDGKVWLSVALKHLVSFDMAAPGRLDIVTHPVLPTALGVNEETDALFVMRGGDFEDDRRLYRTNAPDGTNDFFTWESGSRMQGRPINFGWAQVFSEDGTYGDDQPITMTVTTEKGPQVYTVQSGEPFRLRPGFLVQQWAVKIETNGGIKAIHLAEHNEEIKGIPL